MRDLEAVAANIVEGDWAEKRTWVLRIALALRQARAEGAAEERTKSEGMIKAAEIVSQIYFEIAESVIGEDEVRRRRDAALLIVADRARKEPDHA